MTGLAQIKPIETEGELQALTEKLAFFHAMTTIEACCARRVVGDGYRNERTPGYTAWYDTTQTAPEDASDVAEAVAYLKARGLLDRGAGELRVVRVRYPVKEWW